ncbi:MAG TPA: type II secretion system protein GspC [Steroidobacteraceae bacterium]|nr:type II secretion system protein GspC [Steroidobacteraceae bacterium]
MNAVSWLEELATPNKWRGALQAHGPQIAVWGMTVALAGQAAIIVTHLAGAGQRPPAETPSMTAAPQHVDVATVTNSHLFGAAPAATPVQANDANAPKSSMPLVLTGIIAANDPKAGLAILGESSTAAKVYAVGDNVPGGARVHAVYEDRVLLERGGSLEALVLPRQFTAGAGAPQPLAAAENPAERMRRVISEEPGLIADVMRPQPVFADGKQRGYRVYPGRNRMAFMRLGLRPGDLVIAVNSTPLDDPARGEEIFRTLSSASEAHVTVMRNGRQQDLTLNMSQLASEADQLAGQPPEPAPGVVGAPPPQPLPGEP